MEISPLKAIRNKCLDCCCYQQNEVKLCPIEDCPLHKYRFGKNPARKINKALTEEEKFIVEERMKKARKAKIK